MFLSLCHHNSAKFFKHIDTVMTLPTMIFPVIASSTMVLQLGGDCDDRLNYLAATLDAITAILVVCKRMFKVDLKQKNHENMSMFYQETKRDIEYFLAREHTFERCLAFEDMVNEKLNTLSLIAEDIPKRVEDITDKQMQSTKNRATARAELLEEHKPAVNVSSSDSPRARSMSLGSGAQDVSVMSTCQINDHLRTSGVMNMSNAARSARSFRVAPNIQPLSNDDINYTNTNTNNTSHIDEDEDTDGASTDCIQSKQVATIVNI
jgi:hypothetical protein